jgi:hypothetical protein
MGGQESVLEWWRRSRRFLGDVAAGRPCPASAVNPVLYAFDSAFPLPDCCEYAVGIVSERSEGRLCKVDGCYCSPTIFKVPKVFQNCETRSGQLAKEQS